MVFWDALPLQEIGYFNFLPPLYLLLILSGWFLRNELRIIIPRNELRIILRNELRMI